jgi:hypothetical protein
VFDVDFVRVMSEGGGVIGSSAMAIRRTPPISGAAQRRKWTLDGASILPPNFAVYLWTFQGKKRIFFAMSKGKITDRFSVGGASENYRNAKYRSITKSVRKQLARETANWERIARAPGAC